VAAVPDGIPAEMIASGRGIGTAEALPPEGPADRMAALPARHRARNVPADPTDSPMPDPASPPTARQDTAPAIAPAAVAAGTVVTIERALVLMLCAGLMLGVLQVLRPFATAILFGGVLAISAWPLRERLVRLGLGRGAAAGVLLLLALATLALPALVLAPGLSGEVARGSQRVSAVIAATPRVAPDWVGALPLVGSQLAAFWNDLFAGEYSLVELVSPYSEQLRQVMVGVASAVAESLLQLVLALVVATMFWIDGPAIAGELRGVLRRLGGDTAAEALDTTAGAVRGVAYGVVGTAAFQGVVMGIGLFAARVPGAAALGFTTMMLAISQIGSPLISVIGAGAAWWQFHTGSPAWGWFLIAWTLLVVGADNFVRPWLISFGVVMPIALVILGVFGGFLSFGFLGLFIGPSLLAVAYTLLGAWREHPR
jgi:predicted PurR-regulated permease PerM